MIRLLRRFLFSVARHYRVYSTTPVNLVVILQRGCHLEKVKAPEHRPFRWRYNKPFSNCLGVDAERNPGGVHREIPRCESDQPGESFPVIALDR